MLNDVSAVVVDLLGSARTLESIADRVLGEYDAQREIIMRDVEHLIQELIEKNAVEEVSP